MKKYKIGYTTGVFDLFHIGHLNILRKAKEKCEYLIVGVTTDEEVERVKSKTPIISFSERLAIVQSIKYVDIAVPEKDVDKLIAWDKYNYDVIFKGDDWRGSAKWMKYEEEFKKRNVKVIFFPYTKGISSTKLREILKKQ